MNGGGQIRDETTHTLNRVLLSKVEAAYNSVNNFRKPGENEQAKYILQWLKENEIDVKKYFHTEYHKVEKLDNGMTVKW